MKKNIKNKKKGRGKRETSEEKNREDRARAREKESERKKERERLITLIQIHDVSAVFWKRCVSFSNKTCVLLGTGNVSNSNYTYFN